MSNIKITTGYTPGSIGRITELDAARHLYGKFGFVLAEQFQGMQWGKEVNEQRFELVLE